MKCFLSCLERDDVVDPERSIILKRSCPEGLAPLFLSARNGDLLPVVLPVVLSDVLLDSLLGTLAFVEN